MQMHMQRRGLTSALLILALVGGLGACGGDDSVGGGVGDVGPSEADGSEGGGNTAPAPAGGGSGESDVKVTVDGQEYVVTTVQSCTTEGDERSDLSVYGFAETGERVEMSFSQQDAADSPTGAPAYYGSVGISSGEVQGQVTTDEPFAFLEGDRSSVSGDVTMEHTDTNGSGSVEVSFDITCP